VTTKTKDRAKLRADLVAAETEMLNQGRFTFERFLRYVQVPSPGYGVQPFKTWPHIPEIVEALRTKPRIIVLKARQVGLTTTLGSDAIFDCFQKYANIALISQGEVESVDFLQKAAFIHRHLPLHLQVEVTADNLTQLSFANGAKISAFPSTKKAGRGQTFSKIVVDECEWHEYFEENLAALLPAVTADGQIILISTIDESTLDSKFKTLCREAPANGWHLLFYPWNVVPGRDSEWYDKKKKEYGNALADIARFEKEYPNSIAQALSPAQAQASFDLKMLELMRRDVHPPIQKKGRINIYQKRRVGQRYVAATDVALGVGGDFSVTVVMERDTLTVVADIMDNHLEPEGLALQSMKMLEEYGNPLWAIEDNDKGDTVLTVVEQSGYPSRSIYRGETGRGIAQRGWHSDVVTRSRMWEHLKATVGAGQLHIPNKEGLNQFFSIYSNPKNRGRDEALGKAHDDYPTAVGIALQALPKVRSAFGFAGHVSGVAQPTYW
jgi:hypothetical protein